MENPCLFTAREAAAAIARKQISSVELVQACLGRIDAREPEIGAWTYVDTYLALREARQRDSEPPRGPLHGVPIGIKDVIDTRDMPTEYGSLIHAGNRPRREAACVSLVRRAGGVILGKTVTTEFAMYQPGKTANPHDSRRTPGGSSSGSAAAVADFHVPIAFGTQTSGSIIRPAAFCGVVGYKPSFNTFSPEGIKPLAASLDTLGYITRTVDDLSLMREVLLGPVSRAAQRSSQRPRLAVCRTPYWASAAPETGALFEQTAQHLAANGFDVEELVLPDAFNGINDLHAQLMAYETARNYVLEYDEQCRNLLGLRTRQTIEDGWRISTEEYLKLRAAVRHARTAFADICKSFDAVMVPAAPGEAPPIAATGDPVFNRMWSLLGVPALSLPAGTGPNGLPVGVQFVAGFDEDLLLLEVCGRIERLLAGRAPTIAWA
jgi:Asp-tRNA(Asn)/Glu-tRNA(Gln) amidotransferase A subunit family amidase